MWVRQDELHKSLDIDTKAVRKMEQVQRVAYFKDLKRRRNLAHNRTRKKNMKSLTEFAVWMKKQFEDEMKKRGITPER